MQVLLATFVVQSFGLMVPIFTQVVIDKVLVHHSLSTLNVVATAFLAVITFEFLLNLARNYVFVHTANRIDAKLGSKLFSHLMALPMSYFENRKVGNIITRIRELDSIREFITQKSVSVVLDMIFGFVFVIAMGIYSLKLLAIVLGFVLVNAILFVSITPQLRKRLEDKFIQGAKSNSFLVEAITGILTIKGLSIEGQLKKKWEDHLGNFLRSNFNLTNFSHISSSFSTLFNKLMTLSILFVGVSLVIDKQITVGQLIAFQMFSGQFAGPIMRLVGLWNELQQNLLAVDRLGDILNSPSENMGSNNLTLPKIRGELKIKDLSFRYRPDTPDVLKKLNLTLNQGESLGLVGRSGSGKSTITKLIQRLYLPNQGQIILDGVDIRHLDSGWLRYNIGVVLQENYLFSGTIKENILSAAPDASAERMIEAARLAGADEFISAFPMGYDTEIGERGSSLSGGQRQRIALARALITNPRILILDEATSALDYESEELIMNNLEKIMRNRTVIIIAHRLRTVRNCSKIIALDDGQIIEEGNHNELMNSKGYYYTLNSEQKKIS